MRTYLLTAAVLAVFASVGRSDDYPAPKKITKAYSVGDLVTPVPDVTWPPRATPTPAFAISPKAPSIKENADKLVQLIKDQVRPDSWVGSSFLTVGVFSFPSGTIEFSELGLSLVVNQTEDVHKQIDELLTALHKLQNTTIACEVRLVTASIETITNCNVISSKKPGEAVFLTGQQLKDLLKAVEGDRLGSVIQTPRITFCDGQAVTVRGTKQLDFVTGIETRLERGQVVSVPKKVSLDVGTSLRLTGRISADGKAVAMGVNLIRTCVADTLPVVTIVTQVTPVVADGSKEVSEAPISHCLQEPGLTAQSLEQRLIVPSGGNAVIALPPETREDRQEFRTPILSDIPLIGRLYTSIGIGKVDVQTLVIISPVVIAPDEPTKPEAAPMHREVPAPIYPVGPRIISAPPIAFPAQPAPCAPRNSTPFRIRVLDNGVWQTRLVEPVVVPVAVKNAVQKDPEQVMLPMMVVRVPKGFIEKVGVAKDSKECLWGLTDREARMLTAAIQAEPERMILTKPTLMMLDQLTADFQCGPEVMIHVTPKILPDNTVLLREEVKLSRVIEIVPKPIVQGIEPMVSSCDSTFRAESIVPFGGTLVSRIHNGEGEVLALMTPQRIQPIAPTSAVAVPALTVCAPSPRFCAPSPR